MWWKFPNLIEFETEQEYKELFISEYIEKEFKTHDWIIIKVQEWHFEHIFYRDKWTPNVYFDKWLARRILFLRPIVENVTWNIEIYDWPNFKSKRDERSYIYVYWKMCIFLWKMWNWNFFPITAYQKNNKELERIRKSKNIKRIV